MAACGVAPCVVGASSSRIAEASNTLSRTRLATTWMQSYGKVTSSRGSAVRLNAAASEGSLALANAAVVHETLETTEDSYLSELPTELEDAVEGAAEATCTFLAEGGKRALVELTTRELENYDGEGVMDLQRECARQFIKAVQKQFENKQIKAIFGDIGISVLVEHNWSDTSIKFGNMNDRKPVSEEDDIVILIYPHYTTLDQMEAIANSLVDENNVQEKPLILWNPSFFNTNVGRGSVARQFEQRFVSTFTTTYKLQVLPIGTIFKKHPGTFKMFVEDDKRPGRIFFLKEQEGAITYKELCEMGRGLPKRKPSSSSSPSFLSNAMSSLNRFIDSFIQK